MPTHVTPIANAYTNTDIQYNGPSPQTTRIPPSIVASTMSHATNARSYSHTHNISQTTFHSVTSSTPGIPSMAGGGRSALSSIHGENTGPWQPASFGTSHLTPSSSTAKRRERLVVLTYDGDENVDAETSMAPSTVVTQHVDSGIRSTNGRTGPVVELPPVYTPN
jgi:hypothetical protein